MIKKIFLMTVLLLSLFSFSYAQNADIKAKFCQNVNGNLLPRQLGFGVKELQWVLQQYTAPWLQATDYYGPVTTAAVRNFQRLHGISPTGNVGPQTLSKMRSLWCTNTSVGSGNVITQPGVVEVPNNIQMNINPIASQGNNVSLGWTSQNTTACYINGEQVATSGSRTYTVYSETTYNFRCVNGSGQSKEGSIVLRPEYSVNLGNYPIVNSFTASSQNVAPGSQVLLTWSVQNANTCNLNGEIVSTSGNKYVQVNQNSNFTLSCSGNGGNVQSVLSVNSSR